MMMVHRWQGSLVESSARIRVNYRLWQENFVSRFILPFLGKLINYSVNLLAAFRSPATSLILHVADLFFLECWYFKHCGVRRQANRVPRAGLHPLCHCILEHTSRVAANVRDLADRLPRSRASCEVAAHLACLQTPTIWHAPIPALRAASGARP